MAKLYKISELAKYYINRYKLGKDEFTAISDDGRDSRERAVNAEITRILHNAKDDYGKGSLWDTIKVSNSGPRKISIEFFEQHCFMKFSEYIKKNYERNDNSGNVIYNYDKDALARDEFLVKMNTEKAYWERSAEGLQKANQEYIGIVTKNFPAPSTPPEPYIFNPTDKNLYPSLKNIGYGLMIEAIYNVFYEPFHWAELEDDLSVLDYYNENFPTEITPEEAKSLERIQHPYISYIGNLKKNSSKT
ncbi:MAG: hypothetical protein LUE16_11815 [Lachnospiraceae bacterium]|nr:hypothetical protein [Lachnospiraceae bacterium]